MGKTPEGYFTDQVRKYLISKNIHPASTGYNKKELKNKNGWFAKIWCGGMQTPGIPDIIACIKGHFVGIEIKEPNGKTRGLQDVNEELIKAGGGIYYVLKPENFNDFKNDIDKLIKGEKP